MLSLLKIKLFFGCDDYIHTKGIEKWKLLGLRGSKTYKEDEIIDKRLQFIDDEVTLYRSKYGCSQRMWTFYSTGKLSKKIITKQLLYRILFGLALGAMILYIWKS